MSGVVTATILNSGTAIDPRYVLLQLDIIKEVNKVPNARIIMLDGSAPEKKFEISDSDFFKPGSSIEIKLRYEEEPDITVFKGVVVRHGIKTGTNGSLLTVELKNAAVKLTMQRKSMVYTENTDTEIIKDIIARGGMDALIADTVATHKQMVQYYCTDWDFIMNRADVNGLWVVPDDDNIIVAAPDLSADVTDDHVFEYGNSIIYDFEMEADLQGQHKSVESRSWNASDHKMTDPKLGKRFPLKQGSLDPEELSAILHDDSYNLVSGVYEEEDALQAWADAKIVKDRLSMLRGRIRIPGAATIKPLDMIEVKGAGNYFSGKTLITGVRHQVDEKGWQTDVQFGTTAKWFSENRDIADVPGAGLLPPVNGIQIGIVEAFEEDPDGFYRVKVNIPSINETEGIIWARLLSPDAGNSRGIFFRPEKDDEVIVGFINDDPRQAIILGYMYSPKNAPPFEATEENIEKGLVTKSGLKLLFNDNDKSIELSTPGGNKIVISDRDGICLEDKDGNTFTLNSDGITLNSSKDIPMQGTNISFDGTDIKIKGSSVKVEGSQVDIN